MRFGASQKTMEDIDMGDFYTEQLIKKQGDMKDLVIKAVLVAVAIVSVLTVFIFPMGLIFQVCLTLCFRITYDHFMPVL